MSTAYPTALDTDTTLPVVVNNLGTTLSSSYTSPASTLTVSDNSGFPANGGFVYVGGERGTYTGKSGSTLTGIAGIGNNYAAGTVVELLLDADHINYLKAAILAIETKLGIASSADTASVDYILTHKPDLSGSNPVALGTVGPGTGSGAARYDHVHPTTGLELTANKATDLTSNDNTHYPSTAAVKAYVDSVAAGLDVKASCVVATTANITLSGTQTIDGVAVVASDRVLVKNQTTTSANGIYVVASGAWARSTDMDSWAEIPGSFAFIEKGTTYADCAFVCTADAGGTLETTSIAWSQFAGAGTFTAGAGLTLSGTQFSVNTAGSVVGTSDTQTLTNKRITARVGSTTSSATPTINTDNVDVYKLTAQTADITSFTTNLSGTPTDNQVLIIEITGTAARAITWGSSFEASTVALPTTTVSTNMLAVGFLWNAATSKWRCVAAV